MTYEEDTKITLNGTILLGNLVACDGHDYSRQHFVFSHIHEDHVGNHLSTCMYNGHVYASVQTIELLEAINNEEIKRKKQVHALSMNKPYTIEGNNNNNEVLRLIESKHVLGAAQVEILNKDNKKFVYTGDITTQDMPPDNIDTLIIDSTHGSPQFDVEPDDKSIRNRFIDKSAHSLKNNVKPVVVHAHRGTLQDLMGVVSSEPELCGYHLLAPTRDVAASKIYRRYKYPNMRQIIDDKSDEGLRIRDGEYPWIQFTTYCRQTLGEIKDGHYGAFFTSYNNGRQIRETPNFTYFLDSSHATFSHLLSYVNQAKPHNIVVDNYRTCQGKKFANMLKGKGYNIVCQP